MSVGYSKAFNEQARPGFDPAAAEAAMRRAKDAEDAQAFDSFQRQLSGAAADAGEMTQAAGAARENGPDSEKEREKKRQRELFEAARRLAEIENRLELLHNERAQILDDIRDIQQNLNILGEAFRQIEEDGDLQRDEDGNIRDPAIEAQLRAYERRTGRSVDRQDPEALLVALDAQIRHNNAELDRRNDRVRDIDAEIDDLRREQDELEHKLDTEQAAPDADSEDAQRARLANTVAAEGVEVDLTDLDADQDDEFDDLLDGIDVVVQADGEYESYADEIDPEGAVARPASKTDEPEADQQPDSPRPDTPDDPATGGPATPGMGG